MTDNRDPAGARMAENGFASWNARRSTLVRLFQDAKETAASLEKAMKGDGKRPSSTWLSEAERALGRESFRVMVFGDFSSGKSTLINALLGEDDLLPTKENPTTAFTTVLRWGEVKRAELYRDLGNGGPEEPEQVTVGEFQRRVALRMDEDGEPLQSPYSRGVVYLPFDLLRSGVELIDSAGTNESAARERVTLSFLPQVDAIIFVTPAKGAFKKHDQDHYLEMLGKLGHQDVFFVVNQFDLIRKESDRKDVRLRCQNIVGKYTRRQDRLFFTSASDALSAADDRRLQESGVPALMAALSDFCINDRSRVKLLRPTEVLRLQVSGLRKKISDRRKMLERDADELQSELDAQRETRERLQVTLARIASTLASWVDETEKLLADAVELHVRQLVSDVPNWPLPPKLKIRLLRGNRYERWEEAVQQIDDALTRRLQREMHQYTVDDEGLAGFLRDRESMLQQALLPLFQAYEANMTELRSALTGSVVDIADDAELPGLGAPLSLHLPAEVLSKTSPGWSWGTVSIGTSALAVAGGSGLTLAGGLGLFTVGALFTAIAAPIGLVAAGIGGPLVIRTLAKRKLRENAVEEYRQALERNAEEIAKRHAAQYAAVLRALTEDLSGQLRDRIEETISEAEGAIEKLRSNRVEVDEEQRRLSRWEDSLIGIEDGAAELAREVLADMR
ncbi:dynamin family protein [Actinoallomurus sp. CA-150999]|uniref:dynamin family protein n=1 Tax=Actinoallomurus sp. CA-150999 TaxID=3239887 RepID=UPI003D8B13C8